VTNVAPSDANCLIVGENGTGKELIANAIHSLSKRAKGAFIKVNCAAIPKDLIESELFGYKKGAFTGAVSDKEGLFEMAEGGSLLLDEIAEMPAYLQTKLLRVLQEREYRPVGSDRVVRVDFRLICATNVDVEAALRENRIREDLYFRINTIMFKVSPLRERTEDIPLIAEHFLDQISQREGEVKHFAPEALARLAAHAWPGNVRELRNIVYRAYVMANGPTIVDECLPPSAQPPAAVSSGAPAITVRVGTTLAEIERQVTLATLQHLGRHKEKTAATLGISLKTLYNRLKEYSSGEDDPATIPSALDESH
jgi:DNA-binding NtrC family response regulator